MRRPVQHSKKKIDKTALVLALVVGTANPGWAQDVEQGLATTLMVPLTSQMLAEVAADQPQNSCAALKDTLDKVSADAKKLIDDATSKAQDETQGDQSDVDACAEGYITWERQHVALDVPEFTMKDQELSLDLPQTTMVQRHIIFDTPSVKCSNKQTGEYPEFYCDTHTVIPKCTTRWKPIITKVCEPFMQRQDIVMGVPEFKIARTSFKMGIPEVTMKRQDWYFNLPEFHLTSGCVGSQCQQRCEAAANKYQQDYQGVISPAITQAKQMVATAADQYSQCNVGVLTAQRDAALAQIDAQISIMQASLNSLTSLGATDAAKDVQASLTQLINQRKQVSDQFDQMINGVHGSKMTAASISEE